jgi:hypothetical protein
MNVERGDEAMADFLPRRDGDLLAWARNFLDQATATQEYAAARAKVVERIRALAGCVQSDRDVQASDRREMGLNVRKKTRTLSPEPMTAPAAAIDFSEPFIHRVRFYDEATPNRLGKPRGVAGCQIWVQVGDRGSEDVVAPPEQMRFIGMATRNNYEVKFEGNEAGKVASYRLRWVNTRGVVGPWGPMTMATVAG